MVPAVTSALHFVGDELGAAGWRLAGAVVHVPAAGHEAAALAQARSAAALVLISAATAERLDAALLHGALAALAPLVVLVPDTQGQVALPDLAARARAQLGMEVP